MDDAKTPWHIWMVGIVSLLWNAVGAFDYTMTQTRANWYMSSFTQEQLDYFYGFPAWVVSAWAIAVWSSVLGSLLIILRSRFAVPLLWISLVAMAVTTLHNFVLHDTSMTKIAGAGALAFTAFIALVAILLLWYATAQRNAGRLR